MGMIMEKIQELKELERRNRVLLAYIANGEKIGDKCYKQKKELYENKLEMIDIITLENKRAGVTARELRKLVEMKPNVPKYETGIKGLDNNLDGGIEIGTFIQLAGESGVGKTYLTLEILSEIANYSKCVFFNFEMGDTRIINRLKKLFKNDAQWDNLIIDNDSRDIDSICNEIILHSKEVRFFVIDSKMKIEVNEKLDEYQKFSTITKKLSKVAQQQEAIIFLINQMSENDIKNKRLAFKGSGDQQYDSDISLFYVKNNNEERCLICNKNRQNDKLFKIKLILNDEGKIMSIIDKKIEYVEMDVL